MARIKDREKALALRKKGYSYSQIKKELGISKSTLSYWLRDFPLSKKRINELRANNEKRIELYRKTMQQKRDERLAAVYGAERKNLLPLSKRELYLAGLMLYWGEGTKHSEGMVIMSNTDPEVLRFFIRWCRSSFDVKNSAFRVGLQLYSDMDIGREKQYWSTKLEIPLPQFRKPYIKKSTRAKINHRGSFGHGTCNVSIGNARIREQILMGIKVLSETSRASSSTG